MPNEFDISILYQAVRENTNIFIKKDSQKENPTYYSRFLDFDEKEKTLLIDIPTLTMEGESLKKNDPMRIFFLYQDSRYTIQSRVLGKKKNFKLRKEKTISALIISLPEYLNDGERRDYFRVTTPPFPVEITLDQELSKDREPLSFIATIHDIAGCGIAVKEDKDHLPLNIGNKVQLKIHLDDEILHIKGLIRNKTTVPKTTRMSLGIEFTHQDLSSMGINQNIRKIMRYVMKRQREILN